MLDLSTDYSGKGLITLCTLQIHFGVSFKSYILLTSALSFFSPPSSKGK